jgi:RecB family endonuclease NucS
VSDTGRPDDSPERVHTLAGPDPAAAASLVAGAVDRGELVTVFGRCTVEYEGRASSSLGPGDRHVMAKPDGTLLVHTDTGQQPVNWQPPGSTVSAAAVDGSLRLRATRTSPDEELVVWFGSVGQLSTFVPVDEADRTLSGTEADLRERVLAEPDLVEPGFRPLATERDTAAGAVDVYGEDREGRTVVLELKRRRVGPDAVGQLSRYVDALARELHADTELRGILVAPSLTDRARDLLAERGLEFVALTPDGD